MDSMPPDALLAAYPDGIHQAADRLRRIVRRAMPDAIERVRWGWRLIGYDIPLGRRTRYFAWVMPEQKHVHLGFQYGAWMDDPHRILRGAHLRLRKVRYVTFRPGDAMSPAPLVAFTREAARVATMSTQERAARAFDHEWPSRG